MVASIYQIGLTGVQNALQGVAEKADKISKAFQPESTEDPTDAIVGIKLDEFQYKASARIIKTADELAKSALDILA